MQTTTRVTISPLLTYKRLCCYTLLHSRVPSIPKSHPGRANWCTPNTVSSHSPRTPWPPVRCPYCVRCAAHLHPAAWQLAPPLPSRARRAAHPPARAAARRCPNRPIIPYVICYCREFQPPTCTRCCDAMPGYLSVSILTTCSLPLSLEATVDSVADIIWQGPHPAGPRKHRR